MKAQIEGERRRLVTLAHQTAVFSRMDPKKFKPLDHYLKRKLRRRKAPNYEGVARMFDKMIERGKAASTDT